MTKYVKMLITGRKSCRYREHKCCVCGRRVMTPKHVDDIVLCLDCAPDEREEKHRAMIKEKIRAQIMATRRY